MSDHYHNLLQRKSFTFSIYHRSKWRNYIWHVRSSSQHEIHCTRLRTDISPSILWKATKRNVKRRVSTYSQSSLFRYKVTNVCTTLHKYGQNCTYQLRAYVWTWILYRLFFFFLLSFYIHSKYKTYNHHHHYSHV